MLRSSDTLLRDGERHERSLRCAESACPHASRQAQEAGRADGKEVSGVDSAKAKGFPNDHAEPALLPT